MVLGEKHGTNYLPYTKEEAENAVCCYCTFDIAYSCIFSSIYSFQEKVVW